jgi:hypothetical protein
MSYELGFVSGPINSFAQRIALARKVKSAPIFKTATLRPKLQPAAAAIFRPNPFSMAPRLPAWGRTPLSRRLPGLARRAVLRPMHLPPPVVSNPAVPVAVSTSVAVPVAPVAPVAPVVVAAPVIAPVVAAPVGPVYGERYVPAGMALSGTPWSGHPPIVRRAAPDRRFGGTLKVGRIMAPGARRLQPVKWSQAHGGMLSIPAGADLSGLGFSLKPPKWIRKMQPGKVLKKVAVPLAIVAGAVLIPGAAPLLAKGLLGAGKLALGAGKLALGAGKFAFKAATAIPKFALKTTVKNLSLAKNILMPGSPKEVGISAQPDVSQEQYEQPPTAAEVVIAPQEQGQQYLPETQSLPPVNYGPAAQPGVNYQAAPNVYQPDPGSPSQAGLGGSNTLPLIMGVALLGVVMLSRKR